ncbi:5'/3'-nucleotidase SurE [Virgisporangium aurantiacum]|uniref:5'-nucleotidase n=1 Tax=Virgisporangium aurantiacum TaxID=175570 RepID=A0A8J3Z134_9ACTN|nr:5'/3'-nucleotidase SurE [Virgisporangium aurantiacum]GIJ53385.1 hypothetical protein Vau01_009010 [Virgisporangium aurantiacum]
MEPVAASPAYIVVLGNLGAFGPPPDVVVSGINRGANAGHAVLHSGTVDDETRNWATAADLAVTLLSQLSRAPAGTVFNLNVPDLPPDKVAGLRRGSLASFGQVQVAIAEAGEGFVLPMVTRA